MENVATIGKQIKPNNMIQVWTNTEINGEVDTHQYDISKEKNVLRMFRSANSEWVEPGEEVGHIADIGDYVLLVHNDEEWVLEYHEVEEVLALLLAYNESRIELRETKTIKSI